MPRKAAEVEWQIAVPAGIEPVTATSDSGILWVRYPPMEVAKPGELLSDERPLGDFAIMYTPLRPGGGDLAQGASKVLVLRGQLDGSYRHIRQLDALAAGRFLLTAVVMSPGAATAGTSETWWLHPPSSTFKQLVTGSGSGGNYLTELHNDKWLFWNQGHANVPTFAPMVKDAKAYLTDLATGNRREVQLGKSNWALDAKWETDGQLHFQLEDDPGERLLDPVSGQVR